MAETTSTFTSAELKKAVTELNEVITPKIKLVARKTADILEDFKSNIVEIVNAKQEGSIPASVVDFYNTHFGAEETDETPDAAADVKPETKPAKAAPAAKAGKPLLNKAAKPAAAKAGKPLLNKAAAKTETTETKKDGKKGSGGRSRGKDSSSVIGKAVEAYMEKGVKTTKELSAYLAEMFPDRTSVSSVASHVVCILGHVKQ